MIAGAAAGADGPCAKLRGVTVEGPQPPSAGARSRGADAPAFTADELRRLTGGRLLRASSRPIRGASVDSRLVGPGQLFVALVRYKRRPFTSFSHSSGKVRLYEDVKCEYS